MGVLGPMGVYQDTQPSLNCALVMTPYLPPVKTRGMTLWNFSGKIQSV